MKPVFKIQLLVTFESKKDSKKIQKRFKKDSKRFKKIQKIRKDSEEI